MLAKFQNRLLLLFSSFLTAKHAPDMKLSEGRVFGGSLKACRGIGDHKISLHLKMIFGVFLPMLSPAGRRIIAFYLFYLSAHDSPTRGHKSKFHFNVLTKDQIKHFNWRFYDGRQPKPNSCTAALLTLFVASPTRTYKSTQSKRQSARTRARRCKAPPPWFL